MRSISLLVLPSLALTALLASACSSSDDAFTSTGSGGSGAGTTTSSTTGAGGDAATTGAGGGSACPQADSMLDVAKAPGAGSAYEAPMLTASCTDTDFVVTSNGIPTYTFIPITPNALVVNDLEYEIPLHPQVAAQPTDIPLLGTIAFAVNGLPIFGPTEGAQPAAEAFGDPVYNGIMDPCLGHTAFVYHYHALSHKCLTDSGLVAEPWMNDDPSATEESPILGWAADGFPIYGPIECTDAACTGVVEVQSGYAQTGDPKMNAWDAYTWGDHAGDPGYLDACNGHTGPQGDYHYHATTGFPYVLGCYAGTPAALGGGMPGGPGGM